MMIMRLLSNIFFLFGFISMGIAPTILFGRPHRLRMAFDIEDALTVDEAIKMIEESEI